MGLSRTRPILRTRPLVRPARLRKLLRYNPDTGVFTWRVKRKGYPHGWKPAGTRAGSIWKDGYRYICIDGTSFKAARLAFVLETGKWPRRDVDHANRNRSDDRWINLRDATPRQNQGNKLNSNNRLGIKGVCYEADRNKYKAYIEMNGKTVNLGRFETAEEASAAYGVAAKKYFGKFARIAVR